MFRRLLLIFTWFISFSLTEARVWTSSKGTSLEAELVSFKEGQVTLRLLNGESRVIAIGFFSEEDQKFLMDSEAATKSTGRKKKKKFNDWTNWDKPWPKLVSTSANDFAIEEIESDEGFVYESEHFQFVADVQLTKSLVKKFAWYFESTLKYIELLPLSMSRTQEDEKHKVVLFEQESDYFANGGPEGSAGVYIGRSDLVIVPLVGLGVKKAGSRYTVDFDGDNQTLSHEVVHSFTDWPYYEVGARGWFTEGIADYISITPYRSGKYITTKSITAIVDYVTAYGRDGNGGKALGEEIMIGSSLKEFMLQDYEDFTANSRLNYGVAVLIVAYFCDLERDSELENLQNFLIALKEGKKNEGALDVLLNGRSFQDLELSIAKAWRSKQIKLEFE